MYIYKTGYPDFYSDNIDRINFEFISKLGILSLLSISILEKKASLRFVSMHNALHFDAGFSELQFMRNNKSEFFIMLGDFILQIDRKCLIRLKKELDQIMIPDVPYD